MNKLMIIAALLLAFANADAGSSSEKSDLNPQLQKLEIGAFEVLMGCLVKNKNKTLRTRLHGSELFESTLCEQLRSRVFTGETNDPTASKYSWVKAFEAVDTCLAIDVKQNQAAKPVYLDQASLCKHLRREAQEQYFVVLFNEIEDAEGDTRPESKYNIGARYIVKECIYPTYGLAFDASICEQLREAAGGFISMPKYLSVTIECQSSKGANEFCANLQYEAMASFHALREWYGKRSNSVSAVGLPDYEVRLFEFFIKGVGDQLR